MTSTTSSDLTYRVIQLPTASSRLSDLIIKFRDTKPAALQTSPSEWIYQYNSESVHAFTVWENRFVCQNKIFVAVLAENTNQSTEDTLLQGEWVAFAVIRGPVSVEKYYAVPEMEQPSFAVAKETTAALEIQDGPISKARIRLFCNPKNVRLVDTYKRLGFQQSGKVSLKEGLEANGMAESVPSEDAMSQEDFQRRFNTRIGIAMERVFDIA